ncbi:hypothetical protein BHF71_07240 [Vulcanibacillus modesticaldus]|uniref:Uncharacterized protein n=1 Tax=Vulcanibacillus modesticaldus TaxID=337097 RepID=A0A1D2YVY3_9BACI|nr:hypothetical protein [Vulcanibacillus modesticaldus]OEF99898.1 hypothetical protein BHF71_07240 [Vulcanibacillus modesticaldus]
MNFLILLVFIVVIIGILYSNRKVNENLLVLKLFGYYLLGAFYLNLNGLVIPIGIIISLFLKSKINRSIKLGASIFGFIMMIIGFLF